MVQMMRQYDERGVDMIENLAIVRLDQYVALDQIGHGLGLVALYIDDGNHFYPVQYLLEARGVRTRHAAAADNAYSRLRHSYSIYPKSRSRCSSVAASSADASCARMSW